MDPLSQVLSRTTILSARPVLLEAGGVFSLRYDASLALRFGQVGRGEVWVSQDDGPHHRLGVGDCFVLATGVPCVLASAPRLDPGDGDAVCRVSEDGIGRIGTGDAVEIVGGLIELDPGSTRLMFGVLPAVVVIRGADAASVATALARFSEEARSDRPGASLAADHLGHLLCLTALRAVLHDDEPRLRGWVAALADPVIGEAVRAMHDDPGRRWTVAELAAISHLARSSFAARFRALTGEAPLAHVLALRMRVAGHEIRTTDRAIGSIGEDLGYSSEAAFSRAFKRATGVAPSRWRSATPVA